MTAIPFLFVGELDATTGMHLQYQSLLSDGIW